MPGLHFLSQQPEKIAASVEQLVRKELGAPTPIPYQILPGTSTGATAGSLLGEWAKSQIRMTQQAEALCYVSFNMAWPRPFELQISLIQRGLGTLVGKCVFAVPMAKRVPGPVLLEKLTLGGPRGFSGEPGLSKHLNSNRQVLAGLYRLSVDSSTIGNTKLTIARHVEIRPTPQGSVLIINRLPTELLLMVNMGVKDILAFMPTLEAYLL